MKQFRLLFLVFGLLIAFSTVANETGDPVINAIKSEYSQAKNIIKSNDKNKATRNSMTTTMRYLVPGKGMATETVQFFFNTEQFGENNEFVNYQLFFVTRQYKLGDRKCYEEYLYNNNSQPVFVFIQDYDDNGKRQDKRFYYLDGSIYKTLGPTMDYEDLSTMIQAQDYRQSFDNLIRNAKE